MDVILTCHLNIGGLSKVAQLFYSMFKENNIRTLPMFMSLPEIENVEELLANEMVEDSNRPYSDNSLHFHVGIPESLFKVKNTYKTILSTVVEGNILTKTQININNFSDLIFVPSNFCFSSFISSGIPRSKVSVVPYPLDYNIWNKNIPYTYPKNDKFRFLWINTWYERKGWDILLRSWWEEFTRDDPVELIIKSYMENTRYNSIENSMYKLASSMGVKIDKKAPITVIDTPMKDSDLPGFIKSFDALISPHRSEGFGMNPWYAMALGIPVICTAYGGVCDFANDDTAWLIKSFEMVKPSESEQRIFPQFKDIVWANPIISNVRNQMRDCLDNKYERSRRVLNAEKLISNKYSKTRVLNIMKESINKRYPYMWESLLDTNKLLGDGILLGSRHSDGIPIKMTEI